MKILFVIKNMRLDSGVNTSVSVIANQFHGLGHETYIASLSGLGPLADRLNLPADHLISLGPSPSLTLAVIKLRSLVKLHRFDIVHTNLYQAGVVGRIAAIGTNARVVATEHSTFFPHLKWHQGMIDALLARYCTDCLLAVSRSVAATFAARTHISPTVVQVVHNGVDTKGLASPQCQENSMNGCANILVAGRLEFEKNIDLAINIVHRLNSDGRRVTLNVAGGGTLGSALERRCRQRMLWDSVRFLGVVSDMNALMRSMSLVLLSSHWEGCPMIILEAYALGVPVVATSVPGIMDIVDDYVTGLLIDPDDPESGFDRISELLSDPDLRGRLVRNASCKVRKFDAALVAGKHLVHYEAVLRRREDPSEASLP